MEKLDLVKTYKTYYSAKAKPELVTFDAVQYLSITGKGDPSSAAYVEKIQALYPVAYTLKFMLKAKKKDFAVPKLEGLWWFDDARYGTVSMHEAPLKIPRAEWEYRMLIRMPDYVTKANVTEAVHQVVAKKNLTLANSIELFHLHEGKCIQMLHAGPFDTEPATLHIMLQFAEQHGLRKNGHHHEIYLSDFNKTAPAKLKTILREPVR